LNYNIFSVLWNFFFHIVIYSWSIQASGTFGSAARVTHQIVVDSIGLLFLYFCIYFIYLLIQQAKPAVTVLNQNINNTNINYTISTRLHSLPQSTACEHIGRYRGNIIRIQINYIRQHTYNVLIPVITSRDKNILYEQFFRQPISLRLISYDQYLR